MIPILLTLLMSAPTIDNGTFVFEFSDENPIDGRYLTSPSDAIFHNNTLYILDSSEHCVFAINTVKSTTAVFGREGKGPKEFSTWPDKITIENNQLIVAEWNNIRLHTFDLSLNHLAMVQQNSRYSYFHELREQTFRELDLHEVLKKGALWEFGVNSDIYRGSIPPEKVFYNLENRHSLIDVGIDHSVGILNYGGGLEIFVKNEKVRSLHLPVDHLKADYRIDRMRSIFLKSLKLPKETAWLNGVPVLDFAMYHKDLVWVLAKDEQHQGDTSKIWLITLNLKENEIKKQLMANEPNQIRYHDGYLMFISQENANVSVYRMKL